MERRACERRSAKVDVQFFCCNRVHSGTVINLSEKGMFITTDEMRFPFDSQLEVLIPFREQILHVPVSLRRIEMSPDSHDGIGVELSDPPQDYVEIINGLSSVL
jgi:hypothetical protein